MLTPPFVHSPMLNLELISVVYISIKPASTTPWTAILINPKVFLYGSGQVCSIVPEDTTTDAHTRCDEIPNIPLSDQVSTAVELTAIDIGPRTSWNRAKEVIALEVGTYQD